MASSDSPIDRLVAAIDAAGSPACIGIDPVFELFPRALRHGDEPGAIRAFSLKAIEMVAGAVGVVKPQSACFERYGSKGYAILEEVIGRARELGLIVILDAKRADIGSSATHYAIGAAGMGADFITVSPYMGPSSIEPFLDAGLGVFALARTSNPDSDVVQMRRLRDGQLVAESVSAMLAEMGGPRLGSSGLSSLGAVVGATKAAQEVASLRQLMPDQMFLVPGVGAQGGTIADVRPMLRSGGGSPGKLGVVVNASRSVLYPQAKEDRLWCEAIQDAAVAFSREVKALASAAGV